MSKQIFIIEINDGAYVKPYYGENAEKQALETFELLKQHPMIEKIVVNEIGVVDGLQMKNPVAYYNETHADRFTKLLDFIAAEIDKKGDGK